jgi:hypothetical protein
MSRAINGSANILGGACTLHGITGTGKVSTSHDDGDEWLQNTEPM